MLIIQISGKLLVRHAPHAPGIAAIQSRISARPSRWTVLRPCSGIITPGSVERHAERQDRLVGLSRDDVEQVVAGAAAGRDRRLAHAQCRSRGDSASKPGRRCCAGPVGLWQCAQLTSR